MTTAKDQSLMHIDYQEISSTGPGYPVLLILSVLALVAGVYGFVRMEHEGHWITGMNQQIVWGLPHVISVFLIVAASGALNVASIASVFNQSVYKPLGRLSALLSIALLAGGTIILVMDLGQPQRMLLMFLEQNFKSILALNIYLYIGFFLIVAVYIWFQMEKRMNRYAPAMGKVAFVWRLLMTTGTGSIFGFIVAREAYDTAILAPTFILLSLSVGMAFFILLIMGVSKSTGRQLDDTLLFRLRNLMAVFVASVLLFVLTYHLTKLYAAKHAGVEAFLLLNGGSFTRLFWYGQILLGSLLPLLLTYLPTFNKNRLSIIWASLLVILGGLIQIYLVIIAGQAFPLKLFPGKDVSSGFYDGVINSYSPSMPEIMLVFFGIGLALLILLQGMRNLPFVPLSFSNENSASTS